MSFLTPQHSSHCQVGIRPTNRWQRQNHRCNRFIDSRTMSVADELKSIQEFILHIVCETIWLSKEVMVAAG